ncbi:HNH endonuclease [Streptomyces chumphonensis]|uniref:HNH endonuclease n=1 Tax=Streptomyces chumphonensis TaxID=1214925 RepID=UPI003D727536
MPWSSSNRRVQLPSNWGGTVARIRRRDGGQCVARLYPDGQRCPETQGLEVDHIGDPHDHSDSNLQLLCPWHHKRKTAQESATARRRRPRPRRARPRESHPGLR